MVSILCRCLGSFIGKKYFEKYSNFFELFALGVVLISEIVFYLTTNRVQNCACTSYAEVRRKDK